MSDDNQSTIESLDDLYARAASATGSMEIDPRVVMCLIQYVERLNVVVGGHKTPPDEPTVDALYADGSFLILCDLAAGAAVTVVVIISSSLPEATAPHSPSAHGVVPSLCQMRNQPAVPPLFAELSRVIALAVITPAAAAPKAVAFIVSSASSVPLAAVSGVAGRAPV